MQAQPASAESAGEPPLVRFEELPRYPAVVVRNSRQPRAAQAFLDLLLAPAGQDILRRYGFLSTASGDKR